MASTRDDEIVRRRDPGMSPTRRPLLSLNPGRLIRLRAAPERLSHINIRLSPRNRGLCFSRRRPKAPNLKGSFRGDRGI